MLLEKLFFVMFNKVAFVSTVWDEEFGLDGRLYFKKQTMISAPEHLRKECMIILNKSKGGENKMILQIHYQFDLLIYNYIWQKW